MFGWAFKTRDQSAEKLNLLILISPTIIRTAEQLRDATDRKWTETEEAGGDLIKGKDEAKDEDEGKSRTAKRISPPSGLDLIEDVITD